MLPTAARAAGWGTLRDMHETRVWTRERVHSVLSPELAVPAAGEALVAHRRGGTGLPVELSLRLCEHAGDVRATPACVDGSARVERANARPVNRRFHGLPAVHGILSDPVTPSRERWGRRTPWRG